MQTSITRLPDSNLISVVKIHLHLSGWFGTTIEQMLKSVNWERMFIIKLFTNRYIFSMHIFSNFIPNKLVKFDDKDPTWMKDFAKRKIKWKQPTL